MLLDEFLHRLFTDGAVILRQRPAIDPATRPACLDRLARAFADYRLGVAGPLLDFVPETGLAAAEVLASSCWFLLSRSEPPEVVRQAIRLPAPKTAAEHLSGDLVLRYLPQVHRRAVACAADDVLTAQLVTILRDWPLSGVLSDVTESPTTPLDFGGHPGSQLLYAERLAGHRKPAWFPDGTAREYVELVFEKMGRSPK